MWLFFFFLAACGGFANGFLGTGGGIPLVLGLRGKRIGAGKQSYRIALGLMFPLSLFSAFLCFASDPASLRTALPMGIGAAAGGALGSTLLRRLPGKFVHRLFSVLMIAAGGFTLWQNLRGT